MNLHPKLRPAWQRWLLLIPISALMLYKVLRLPRWVLPRAVRSIVQNWDVEMFRMILASRIQRAYIDQPCTFRQPASAEPRVEVDPPYRLDAGQIRQFYERGYMGPFDAFGVDEMTAFREELLAIEKSKSATYGFVTPRDRHLEMPQLWNFLSAPALTERAAQILGPDLLCWRSQIFYKGPGTPAIQWHQASTFMVEDYLDPAIFPTDRSSMFQLTLWVAVDDATSENGCLRFVVGSHRHIRPIRFGGEEGFYKARFSLEFDRRAGEAVEVPVRAGQFIIFTERCIHGSGPNVTDRHRLAFNCRVIPTDVPVYPNKRYYRSVYNGGKYHLDKWGVALLRGTDHHQLSRTIPSSALRGESQRRAA